jgi:hypothetical protein
MARADGTPGAPHPVGLTALLAVRPVYRENRLAYSPLASVQADRVAIIEAVEPTLLMGAPQTVRPRGASSS